MFRPQRAILIKGRDAVFRLYKLGAGFVGCLLYEGENGLFGRSIIPGWQRITGMGIHHSEEQNRRGDGRSQAALGMAADISHFASSVEKNPAAQGNTHQVM
jgi:hypothetical protein